MQSRPYRTLLCAACAAIIALATPAMAQSGQSTAAAEHAAQQAEMQKIQVEMQKLGSQLADIERKAIASDTQLQAKRRQFSAHVIKVMKTLGYDPEGDTKKLAEIKKNVLSGKLNQDERVAQIKKFRSIRARLMEGQSAAMQDKGLQKENQQLSKATMLAMKKQNPHTEDMIKRFNALGAKLRGLLHASGAKQH